MEPVVYWRGALGLFWAFMFFALLALIVGMTFLSGSSFYPYAILLSGILVVFLTAFLLFDKRIKAGFYMCAALSVLFVLNQAVVLYFLFSDPTTIIPRDLLGKIMLDEAVFFPLIVAVLMFLWAIFLLIATVKSKPLFDKEARLEQISWLVRLKAEKPKATPIIARAKKEALQKLATEAEQPPKQKGAF
jgi:hypothetical protein